MPLRSGKGLTARTAGERGCDGGPSLTPVGAATLLGTGNVIAIGGDEGNGDAYGTSTYSRASGSATAELYDAATGSWASVSRPAESRALQIAVLLPDAQVLVAGGLTAGRALSTAELYRPE